MFKRAQRIVFFGILFGSLLMFDYLLGNGFLDMLRRIFCKIFCFAKRTLRNHAKTSQVIAPSDVDVHMLIIEIIALCCTMLILNTYKKYRMKRTNILVTSSDCATETNELLDRLSFRRTTTRSQPKCGDANDIYDITDSAVLSVSSLLDKDFNLQDSITADCIDDFEGDYVVQFYNNRYLWDVIEEE